MYIHVYVYVNKRYTISHKRYLINGSLIDDTRSSICLIAEMKNICEGRVTFKSDAVKAVRVSTQHETRYHSDKFQNSTNYPLHRQGSNVRASFFFCC